MLIDEIETTSPVVIRNQRTTIHDSQIAEVSTSMNIPLVVRDYSENLNRIGEFLLSLLMEENQPVHVDDNLVPLEDQVCASPTLNVQFNRSSATYSTYARHSTVPMYNFINWLCLQNLR